MHLQVALHVLQGDQVRQLVVFGGGDLAGILAQLWRDEIQLQLRIDLFLGAACDTFLTLQGCQSIFVEGEPHVVSPPAQRHVVFFRAGKIEQGRAEILFLQQPHVHLQAVLQREADFVLSVR